LYWLLIVTGLCRVVSYRVVDIGELLELLQLSILESNTAPELLRLLMHASDTTRELLELLEASLCGSNTAPGELLDYLVPDVKPAPKLPQLPQPYLVCIQI
ncbi:hypothetical protein LSH36_226g04001, partial [Paralvinella palmiformis]